MMLMEPGSAGKFAPALSAGVGQIRAPNFSRVLVPRRATDAILGSSYDPGDWRKLLTKVLMSGEEVKNLRHKELKQWYFCISFWHGDVEGLVTCTYSEPLFSRRGGICQCQSRIYNIRV